MAKNKKATAIAMLLVLTFALSLVALPTVKTHDPPWTFPSYAYLVPSPDPVGVGQKVSIVMWIDYPLPSSNVNNDVRRHDYTLTITDPDGSVETEHWDVVQDTTSIQYYQYTPAKVGVYTLLFEYEGQTYTWSGSYQNDTFTPASKTTTFTVQEEQLPEPTTSYPLPTEYWTRPIEGQNTDWYTISSNWLGFPSISGAGSTYGIPGGIQPEGIAPNSPHIMWARPIQDGGVVGGSGYHAPGTTYYMGGSYNTRFGNALVMHGRLYYELPWGNSGSGGGYMCVDLRTGETIWGPMDFGTTLVQWGPYTFESAIIPSYGYLYDFDMYNQHGVVPSNGWLFSSNFGTAIDPLSGRVADLNITNVPSGSEILGPQGEHIRYVLYNAGTRSNPVYYLQQWNSSKVFDDDSAGTRDASSDNRYDWNVSMPTLEGSWSIASNGRGGPFASLDNMLLMIQGSLGGRPGTYYGGDWDGANITAVSLKPTSIGQVLWTKFYPAAEGNISRTIASWDPERGVFITADKETNVHQGWSLTDGSKLWGPTEPTNDYTYFRQTDMVAYGKLYFAGYGGILYCYDVTNGDLLWTYGNGGPGNSTYSGLETAWGTYPIFVDVIADGKIYLATTEHSPGSPYYKDVRYRCVNATNGEEIWTLMGWGTGMDAGCDVVADGFFVFLNCYDMRVYCVGKGPSAMTVEAPMTAIKQGDSLVIRGTVMDVAAGTEQDEQAARFPYGVPAVSDDSMTEWMEYVYMQKPRPTDVTGVDVTLSVLDSNNNFREIGTVASDSDGFFSYQWTPDIPGEFKVIASFGGSESYWPSHAVTAFAVDEAPEATPPPTPTPMSTAELYFVPGVAGIIVAIAVVGAVLLLMLRKR